MWGSGFWVSCLGCREARFAGSLSASVWVLGLEWAYRLFQVPVGIPEPAFLGFSGLGFRVLALGIWGLGV